MSQRKKDNGSGFWGKVGIGIIGVVGGLLLGKAVD